MDFPIYLPHLFGPPCLLDFWKISHPPTIWNPRLLGTKEYHEYLRLILEKI